MINATLCLIPAYGRDYATEEDLLKDWNDGKDFKMAGGPYCSIRDFDFTKGRWDQVVVFSPRIPNIVLYCAAEN